MLPSITVIQATTIAVTVRKRHPDKTKGNVWRHKQSKDRQTETELKSWEMVDKKRKKAKVKQGDGTKKRNHQKR